MKQAVRKNINKTILISFDSVPARWSRSVESMVFTIARRKLQIQDKSQMQTRNARKKVTFCSFIWSITLYLSYRYLFIKLPAPRSPMGSLPFFRWCWLSCCGAFVLVSWRNKSGPITLSSSDGLSSIKAYYSGELWSRMMVLMCSFWIMWCVRRWSHVQSISFHSSILILPGVIFIYFYFT